MNKTEILVIDRNEDTMQSLIRLINNNLEWNGVGAGSDEDAIEKFHQRSFDMVLLINGNTEVEEKKLRKIFTHQNPDVIIMQHLDGDSGLLISEIEQSLDKLNKNKKPSFSFVDDALKNARLNINIE